MRAVGRQPVERALVGAHDGQVEAVQLLYVHEEHCELRGPLHALHVESHALQTPASLYVPRGHVE